MFHLWPSLDIHQSIDTSVTKNMYVDFGVNCVVVFQEATFWQKRNYSLHTLLRCSILGRGWHDLFALSGQGRSHRGHEIPAGHWQDRRQCLCKYLLKFLIEHL